MVPTLDNSEMDWNVLEAAIDPGLVEADECSESAEAGRLLPMFNRRLTPHSLVPREQRIHCCLFLPTLLCLQPVSHITVVL